MIPSAEAIRVGYLAELRSNWRPLFAATFGFGTSSSSFSLLSTSVMAPHLLAELGWSRAAFAMLGTLSLVGALCVPFAGRLADILGVRRTALIGIAALPLILLGFAAMTGPIWQYVALQIAHGVLCVTTTAAIYGRLVVQCIERARGLALAIVISGAAIAGMIGAPLLNAFTEAHGWRAGYVALAVVALSCGIVTLFLLPKDLTLGTRQTRTKRSARDDYPIILRTPAFWILFGGMLLCHLPCVVAVSQLKMVLLANGVSAQGAAVMLSAFSSGMLVGRFLVGFALDRLAPHVVATVGMGLPAIGLFIFAANFEGAAVLTFASFLVGFSFGADGDVAGYFVARNFGVTIYSSVMGLITMAITLSIAIGAALLSLSLKLTGGYDTFLLGGAVAILAGASLFLLLGRQARPASVLLPGEPQPAIP